MWKTVMVGLLSFIIVSASLVGMGYLFGYKLFMFTFYEETAAGVTMGGSVVPFILAIAVSYVVGNAYEKKQQRHNRGAHSN
ncbi:hypothetical protein [Halobacillus trueperi]|uniref:hypothetical protein n=1 Tax=Halobacillus trueperi TaxID=156205 RepID=UPI003736EBE5